MPNQKVDPPVPRIFKTTKVCHYPQTETMKPKEVITSQKSRRYNLRSKPETSATSTLISIPLQDCSDFEIDLDIEEEAKVEEAPKNHVMSDGEMHN